MNTISPTNKSPCTAASCRQEEMGVIMPAGECTPHQTDVIRLVTCIRNHHQAPILQARPCPYRQPMPVRLPVPKGRQAQAHTDAPACHLGELLLSAVATTLLGSQQHSRRCLRVGNPTGSVCPCSPNRPRPRLGNQTKGLPNQHMHNTDAADDRRVI